jgi:hypothetical protein
MDLAFLGIINLFNLIYLFFVREGLTYQEKTDTWEETIKQTAERRRLNALRIKQEAQEAMERSRKTQLIKLQLKDEKDL